MRFCNVLLVEMGGIEPPSKMPLVKGLLPFSCQDSGQHPDCLVDYSYQNRHLGSFYSQTYAKEQTIQIQQELIEIQ
jgi:hypothetical protein